MTIAIFHVSFAAASVIRQAPLRTERLTGRHWPSLSALSSDPERTTYAFGGPWYGIQAIGCDWQGKAKCLAQISESWMPAWQACHRAANLCGQKTGRELLRFSHPGKWHHACRIERTRRDGMDSCRAFFQVAGQLTVVQNGQASKLAPGSIALVDAGRPMTLICEDGNAQWLSLVLPRASLVTHLGSEPRIASSGRRHRQSGRFSSFFSMWMKIGTQWPASLLCATSGL
jgi:hypothetical protein